MTSWKTALTRSALDALYYTSAYRAFSSNWSGAGIIFTLHHVCPADTAEFAPNRILEITPDFLDRAITLVLESGLDVITLDEMQQRLTGNGHSRPFVCFTLDDGYADNHQYALPVFLKHRVPFLVYVASGFPDGTATLWWRLLEYVIRDQNEVTLRTEHDEFRLSTTSTADKWRTFDKLYWILRKLPHEEAHDTIARLIEDYRLDKTGLCQSAAMSWEMITDMVSSGLATIGAHTRSHYFLSKLSETEMLNEIESGRQIITERIGHEPEHFAYPYGDRESAGRREFNAIEKLGFMTATTTRKGVLFPEHRRHLHALPRVSLNGDYQTERYLKLFLSGIPFALARRFQKLDVN